MKYALSCTIGICFVLSSVAQYQYTTIKMDKRFDYAIEISSIVCLNDTLYLASPKCDSIYIGKVNKQDSLEIFRVSYLGGCDYEGASFYKGFFYFSDDGANAIFKYKSDFKQSPKVYPLRLKGSEGAQSNNGFEGIAAINDTTFYILLEKVKRSNQSFSVLYKGMLRGDSISLVAKKYIRLSGNRYCDLWYNRSANTLYLLKTAFGKYAVDSLRLDAKHNVPEKYKVKNTSLPQITTGTVLDFSDAVNSKAVEQYGTNVEGLSQSKKNIWYVISDNCDAGKLFCRCQNAGENLKTLLMRIEKK